MELIKNNLENIIIALAVVLVIVLLWNIFLQASITKIKRRNALLFSGNKIKNLEEVLLSQAQSLKILDKDIQELYVISNQINNLTFHGLHKTGLVRFNPFKEVGGNRSFALVFLNGKNNGIVISSLYTREGIRFYAKAVTSGKSEKYPLTEEEEQAIKIAINNGPKKIS